MKLKLIRRTTTSPEGQKQTSAAVVNADTGEPIDGIVGLGVMMENGMEFLQVRTRAFVQESLDEPQIAIANRMPIINGR